MPDAPLAAAPALAAAPGRHGRTGSPPGLVVQEQAGRQITGIAARRGQAAAVTAAVERRWGVTLPPTPRFVSAGEAAFVWSGAAQWLAHAPGGSALDVELGAVLDGIASFVAQGDGRVVLRVHGPAARTVLATGIPIDLHPRAFAPGDTAITLAGHIGVQIRQLDEGPTYELTAFRGFADDLCGWLVEAGQVHGVELVAPA